MLAELEDTRTVPSDSYVSHGKLMNGHIFVCPVFVNSVNLGTLMKLFLAICKTEDELLDSGDPNEVVPPWEAP